VRWKKNNPRNVGFMAAQRGVELSVRDVPNPHQPILADVPNRAIRGKGSPENQAAMPRGQHRTLPPVPSVAEHHSGTVAAATSEPSGEDRCGPRGAVCTAENAPAGAPRRLQSHSSSKPLVVIETRMSPRGEKATG